MYLLKRDGIKPKQFAINNIPMSDQQTTPPPPKPVKPPIMIGDRGVLISSFEDLQRFSEWVFASGFAPKDFDTPQRIGVAIQMGLELGMSPLMALQNIAVVHNRATVFGPAMKALVDASGLLENYAETWVGEPHTDGWTCTVTAKRKGNSTPFVGKFSLADAKRADLLRNPTWQKYPQDMLMYRANSRVFNRGFPDVLKGLRSAEEARDDAYNAEQDVAATEAPAPTGIPRAALPENSSEPDVTIPLKDLKPRVKQTVAAASTAAPATRSEAAQGRAAMAEGPAPAREVATTVVQPAAQKAAPLTQTQILAQQQAATAARPAQQAAPNPIAQAGADIARLEALVKGANMAQYDFMAGLRDLGHTTEMMLQDLPGKKVTMLLTNFNEIMQEIRNLTPL